MDDSLYHERQTTDSGGSSSSGAMLRRPMQIVKKRSGPLEDALAELNSSSTAVSPTSLPPQQSSIFQSVLVHVPQKAAITARSSCSRRSSVTTSPPSPRRRPTIKEKKDKEKKRSERWLLTRKTWKYMTDAGRKLIPEGAQNRAEDIPKIECHFHQVCANEPRFVLWRRKSSYPGATRNSKRRFKQLLSHTGLKTQTQASIEQEETQNADQIIDLLQSYLKLDEARKTTTLLGSKTVRPDQTASPSAQRPGSCGSSKQQLTASGTLPTVGSGGSARGLGFLPSQPPRGLHTLSEIEQLLERLRALSRSATCRSIMVPLDRVTPDILENKVLLKQIYNELKKQQLHRILGKHSVPLQGMRPSLPHATSLTSLFHFGNSDGKKDLHQQQQQLGRPPATTHMSAATINPTQQSTVLSSMSSKSKSPTRSGASSNTGILQQRQRKPPSTLDLSSRRTTKQQIPVISIKKPSVERTYSSSGTQTSFIQLHEIKRLADEYKERKREEDAANVALTTATDDELSDKSGAIASTPAVHRRKSSIDNEDVSQSVSDTIKRYLRMARKKSVHDDNANRFKRVNYDRNLRNIRAKGEINPPGMDEGNTKAIQTLDAWPVITLDFIRGNECSDLLAEAHAEWRKSLDDRLQKKLDYEEKLRKQDTEKSYSGVSNVATVTAKVVIQPQQQKQSHSSCSSSSAPTSPTMDQQTAAMQQHHGGGASGLLHSSSQFLSNLWHGVGHHQHSQHDPATSNSNTSLSSTLTNTPSAGFCYNQKNIDKTAQTMQKSKSSSNVGQFVSKKILKSRSKSQTRPSSPTLPKWTPAEKFTWTSENGARITLSDVPLHGLTEIEAKVLQRVAIQKINELNIGINVTAPGDMAESSKSVKRRPLSKKKAMTTSFFDIGKKDDKNANFSVFGNSLENCVANDNKRLSNLVGTSTSERGSRNSIASLFRSSSSKVRSCESLPSSAFSVHQQAVDLAAATAGAESSAEVGAAGHNNVNNSSAYFSGNSNLSFATLPLMSRSQSDVRRASQDYDSDPIQRNSSPPATTAVNVGGTGGSGERQVPSFINACIRYLEEYGTHSVGLFRVSTSKKRVRQLREELDRNCCITSLASIIDADTCPHDIATLLKEFLRDLPEPLLCRSLYKAFLETQRIRNRRLQLEAISHLVKLLPPAHRDTLYALLKFLAHVASCSDDVTSSDGSVQISGNKMDSNNLATVFAPNILRSTVTSPDYGSSSTMEVTSLNVSEQQSMADAINVIRTMIDHYEELFRVPVDLVDAIYTHIFDTCPQQLNYLFEQRTNMDNTDEIDSASSNTPLSSPPLVSSTAAKSSSSLQMFGNDFLTDAKTFPQTSKSIPTPASIAMPDTGQSTAITAPVAPARKMYTRESVMHENAASKGGNDSNNSINGSSANSTRRRRSRPKYSDSDIAVHRLLFSGSCSSSSSDPSGTITSGLSSANEQQQQLQKQISSELTVPSTEATAAATSRHQSSPYVLDKAAGIVTASFHIPVQMQGPAVTSAYDDLDDVFYSHSGTEIDTEHPPIDLSDIPYIEDVYGSHELENFSEGFPITGSLSFGSAPPSNYSNNNNKNNIKSTIHGRTKALPPKDDATGANILPSKLKTFHIKPTFASATATETTKTAAASNAISKNDCSGNKNATKAISTLEPKLPTSISNIGGAILRSKTADFERLSLAASAGGGGSNNSSAATLPQQQVGAATTAQQRSAANQMQKQPLYKRQAIISSAKRTTATHK